MLTAKELKEAYERNLKLLQDRCEHKNCIWTRNFDFHGNDWGEETYECQDCWKIVSYRYTCYSCHNKYTTDISESFDYSGSSFGYYCPKCRESGKIFKFKEE